ncbi:uncharacterized protein LOC114528595 [Dendronephthya gigantea]|uniref:uncharacterized protein LOC114528595 n=1 Tax=Dendronephthya gigantea TaxID=151771 RepID=UPI00106ABAB5|nr:uncharacterized protein LOC114528595 [Dendronephthya gigantea]
MMNRRRTQESEGISLRILFICSIIVGLLMMVLGVVFRVYVCHWVARILFAIWIGIFVMVAAGVGLCTRVSRDYGPRYGTPCTFSFGLISFLLCLTMVICLCFSMRDFDDDRWFRPAKPYLVVDPDHCVVERHVNEYYYYDRIKKHGRDGLKFGSVLIGLSCLEMVLILLRSLIIGQMKGYFGATDKQQRQVKMRGERQRNVQSI